MVNLYYKNMKGETVFHSCTTAEKARLIGKMMLRTNRATKYGFNHVKENAK